MRLGGRGHFHAVWFPTVISRNHPPGFHFHYTSLHNKKSVQGVDTAVEGHFWSNVGDIVTAFVFTKAGMENYTDQFSTLMPETQ